MSSQNEMAERMYVYMTQHEYACQRYVLADIIQSIKNIIPTTGTGREFLKNTSLF